MAGRKQTAAIVIVIGLIGLLPLTRRPRFQNYHAVDVLQLLASGACFGVGITLLVERIRSKPNE